MAVLPDFVHCFFWDVDPKTLDPDKCPFFVIERLLEEGDDAVIRWVMSYYTDDQRLEVVKNSSLSRKTARLWQNHYNLAAAEVRRLSAPFRKTVDPFWPYWPGRLSASTAQCPPRRRSPGGELGRSW
ncbi:MAG: DUF6922 domain-containing protein [Bacillota bacterium]